MLSTGQKIDKYRIRSVIGAGGMGEIFLAEDMRLDREVALKVLPSGVAQDSDRMRRFVQEAKATSALNHPNIITIHEIGETDGTHFIVTEYIEGETLRERLKRSSFLVEEALEVAIQVASALQAAHSLNIVHRDIKPENIMLRKDGYVKVLDFGLAKLIEKPVLDEEAQTRMQVQTQAGIVMGTAAYMSPEQAKGRAIDIRTDIWSLGVVLYEMLTRKQPFTGETINHTIVAILEKEPPPLSAFLREYLYDIEKIIQKCLAKNPGDRYQTTKNLIDDLRAVKQEFEFQAKLKQKEPIEILGTAKTEILEAHTGKTEKVQTEPVEKFSTHKNPFTRITGKAGQAIKARPYFPVIFALILIVFFVYAIFPFIWQSPPKNEAVKLFDDGTEALREGAYYKASKIFEDAVKIDNDYTLAHAGLAEAWNELDYLGRAQSEMLKVHEIQNRKQNLLSTLFNSEESLYVEAINSTIIRDLPQAIKIYQKIAELKPAESYVYVDLGRAYEKNEETDKARESYEKAIDFNSQYGAAFLRLGILLRRKAEYQKSNEAFDKAENIYERSNNDEGIAEVKFQRGVSLNHQEKLDDARNQFEQVIANPRANKYQQIRAMLQISNTCASEGKTTCAEEFASKAIVLANSERMENIATTGLIDLGNAFLVRGEYEKAEKNLLTALEFARKDGGLRNEAIALLALGSLRIQQKKPDEAQSFVNLALPYLQKGGYSKELSQARLIDGRANEMKGNFDAALRAFEEVENLERASAADRAYANMLSGNVLMSQERYSEALSHFEKSFDLYQSLKNSFYSAYCLFYLSDILFQLGNFEQAKEKLSKAQQILDKGHVLFPQLNTKTNLLDAQIALSLGNFSEAFTKAKQINEVKSSSVTFEVSKIICLGQTNLKRKEGIENCLKAVKYAESTNDSQIINNARLALSEAYLNTGNNSDALKKALEVKDYFVSTGQLESGWRALLLAALANRQNGNNENAKEYAGQALETLSQLKKRLNEEHFNLYLERPDINHYFRQAEELSRLE